jgi:DNA-binding transcriptional MerR regulator
MTRAVHFSLAEAARQVGVAPITLKRWLLARKVDEVQRDRNGWRLFTAADIERIKQFAHRTIPPKTSK